jgi:N-acetylglucosaminyldiphosphoundecaprenol N-acetyl-beta-D-mannosaminyltransferase
MEPSKQAMSVAHVKAPGEIGRAWLGGCHLSKLSLAQVLERALAWARRRECRTFMAVNVSKLVLMQKDPKLAAALLESDITIADGSPVYYALKLVRDGIPERITGIDLMVKLLELADRERLSVYFLGARPEVLDAVVATCRASYPGIVLAGARDGYFTKEQESAVVAAIALASPDMLFLGLGLPQKEYFVHDHRTELNAGVVLPVGGGFDVLAGLKRRAPALVQTLGVEWLWRSFYDRSRAALVRRSFGPFLRLVLKQLVQTRRPSTEG